MKRCKCGTTQNRGNYCCTNCGTNINLAHSASLPPCPKCNNDTFVDVDTDYLIEAANEFGILNDCNYESYYDNTSTKVAKFNEHNFDDK